MTLSDETFAELRAEWNEALPGIIAGEPDRTDLMRSTTRAMGRAVSVREIISAVSHVTGESFMAIIGESVSSRLAAVRALVIVLASDLRPDLSHAKIASMMNKERSLIRLGLQRAAKLRMESNEFVHWHEKVRKRLGLGPVAQW